MKSKTVIQLLKRLRHWQNGYQKSMWEVERRLNFVGEDREKYFEAWRKYSDSKQIIDDLFKKEIGKAVVNEL